MSTHSSGDTEGSAVDAIVEGLLESIVRQPIDAGEAVPPESDLAERFGVSRLTVREAMKTLVAMGVVSVERGRGTFVNPTDEWSRFHPVVLARLTDTREGAAMASRQLVEARRLVEVGVAELAAERRSDDHVARLTESLAAMWDAHEAADDHAWADADLAFHQTLMDAAGNPFVAVLFTPLATLLRKDRHEPAADGGNRRRALTWHQRILDAVRESDPADARAAMDGHLRDTEAILTAWRATTS